MTNVRAHLLLENLLRIDAGHDQSAFPWRQAKFPTRTSRKHYLSAGFLTLEERDAIHAAIGALGVKEEEIPTEFRTA